LGGPAPDQEFARAGAAGARDQGEVLLGEVRESIAAARVRARRGQAALLLPAEVAPVPCRQVIRQVAGLGREGEDLGVLDGASRGVDDAAVDADPGCEDEVLLAGIGADLDAPLDARSVPLRARFEVVDARLQAPNRVNSQRAGDSRARAAVRPRGVRRLAPAGGHHGAHHGFPVRPGHLAAQPGCREEHDLHLRPRLALRRRREDGRASGARGRMRGGHLDPVVGAP
jgi:hypothetical protein